MAPIDQVIIGAGASYYVHLGNFTAGLLGLAGGGPSLVALPTASVITYNNASILDPTIYNVFTSYQMVTLYGANGTCITSANGAPSPTPLFVQLPSGAPPSIITKAEERFIEFVGGQMCSVISPSSATASISISAEVITLSLSSTPLPISSQSSNTGHTTFATSTRNSTSIASATPENDPGHPQSTRIGIGVGVGIGGVIILVIIGTILWKRNIMKTHTTKDKDPPAELSSKEPDFQAELENNVLPQELSVERRPELH